MPGRPLSRRRCLGARASLPRRPAGRAACFSCVAFFTLLRPFPPSFHQDESQEALLWEEGIQGFSQEEGYIWDYAAESKASLRAKVPRGAACVFRGRLIGGGAKGARG